MGSLEEELRARLEGDYVLASLPAFLDLIWDADMTLDELLALDPPVVVETTSNRRRIVVQRVRGEIRYWLTTDHVLGNAPPVNELGTLASIERVGALCNEFLKAGIDVAEPHTPRSRGGKSLRCIERIRDR